MSKEATLKLALEALENNRRTHYYCEDTWYSCPKHEEGCANESEGDECNCGADKANVEIDGAITALREALAQQALDKKAENARELGLDYEPVWGGGPTNKDYEDAMRQRRLHQLTSPPTLSLAQRQARSADTWVNATTWRGLTDEDDIDWEEGGNLRDLVKAIEAKLRSKNEDRN